MIKFHFGELGLIKKNYIITGGCGFIGTAVAARLLQNKQNNVRILDNLSGNNHEQLSEKGRLAVHPIGKIPTVWENSLELVIGDICDFELTAKVFSGADICIHLAANTGVEPSVIDPYYDCKNNVLGTLSCLEAAKQRNLENFIFASSGAPLGVQKPPLHEELAAKPASPYGASKLSGEAYCSSYFHSYNLNTTSLRFGNVYGPGSSNKNSVIAKFIRQVLDSKALEIFGTGAQTRDFIFIEDLVDAIILACKVKDIGGETFQIASAKEVTIMEIVELLRAEFKDTNIIFPEVIFSSPRVGDVERNFSYTKKAQQLLGWKPKTNLQAGLKQTVLYFLGHRSGV